MSSTNKSEVMNLIFPGTTVRVKNLARNLKWDFLLLYVLLHNSALRFENYVIVQTNICKSGCMIWQKKFLYSVQNNLKKPLWQRQTIVRTFRLVLVLQIFVARWTFEHYARKRHNFDENIIFKNLILTILQVEILNNGKPVCNDVGVFPHPGSCRKFITCSRRAVGSGIVGWVYECPSYLAFDPVGGRCNWANEFVCAERRY